MGRGDNIAVGCEPAQAGVKGAAASPSRGAFPRVPVTLVIATVGFAIFLASVWTARNEAALVPDFALYTARFVKVAGCFVIAFLFRNHIPSVRAMTACGAAFISMHVVVYLCMLIVGAEAPGFAILAVLNGALSGVGEACVIIVYAHVFSTFHPKLSAVAVPAAYLVNEFLYSTTLFVPTAFILVVRPLGKIAGVALLAWCLARKRSVTESDAEYPLQHGLSTKADDMPPLRFLTSSKDWLLILAGATLFPFLFGLIAQMCSNVSTNSGLYDVANEAVALAVLGVLLVLGARRGGRITFETMLYLAFPLYATGCLVLPMLWYQGAPYAGMLVKCGYTACQVIMWMLLAQKAYEDLRHTYLYFGIFYGIFELATAVARAIASNLYAVSTLDEQFMSYLALFSLWLIALYGLLFFAISRRPDRAAKEASGADSAPSSDPFSARLEAFAAQYGLTDREREVLVESIHGYSMENIGKKLYISRETVKTHLRHVYTKAGVGGKQELIAFIDHFQVD